jgi:hypothetical protein
LRLFHVVPLFEVSLVANSQTRVRLPIRTGDSQNEADSPPAINQARKDFNCVPLILRPAIRIGLLLGNKELGMKSYSELRPLAGRCNLFLRIPYFR